jgi:ABC-2 type transport system permease protein
VGSFWQSYWRSLCAVVKDRNVLLLVLVGPLVYSIYYPFPYSSQVVREIPVAIADLDRTSLSRKLIRLADASPDIKVVSVVNDPAQLRQAMWDGDVEGGMIIPREFRRNALHGETSKIIVLGNGAYFMFNRGQIIGFSGAAQTLSKDIELKYALASSVSREQTTERSEPVRLELRAASNPSGGYATYVVPAVAVVVMQQTLLLGIGMLMGTWRESGAPIDMKYRINRLALVFAAATICLINTVYYIAIVYWWEDYPHLGKLQDLLPVILVFTVTAAAWSVAIGSFFRHRVQAVMLLVPTSMPIIFLAGFAWPIESIPAPLVALGMLVPSSAGAQAFLNVDQMGASFIQVFPEVISLITLLFGSLLLIAVKKDF